ncbi:TonB-dependent receptor [Dysgonomonas sp. Marseille-P4677]|uniref:SusC/RagA family TonB-linked outer membrane protein n=1 Tax=Dysgonomonas sp. Marseille-P4677 TaxID=2364790 RepID=UPI0019133A6E|nr:TonB-dependent receptor [Dysgonomonas sp. Marseille-P4677]MBK5720113.1 TonB-dependent receptor [Dysgonomonas sp. Marseille-P4677]
MRTNLLKIKHKTACCLLLACIMLGGLTYPQTSVAENSKEMQQSKTTVTGTVLDENGDALIGVSIVEKGTTNGTTTDIDGKFSISVSNLNVTLMITYVGYEKQEISLNGKKDLYIILNEDTKILDEVVVIGYGTQRKGDVTSAIASVKAEDFLAGNIQDASQLVKGKIAGLTITKASGDPNASSSINLRGMISIDGNQNPLVLIDGNPGDMSTVAPENIASIDVLKDASAAAIYGTRGAGGVIIITTRSGKRDTKSVVNYSGYVTSSSYYKKADFMTPEDIRAGKTTFKDLGSDTDWLKGISQNGYTQNHSLSINGGTQSTTYAATVSYREEDGMIKNTGNNELKMTFDLSQYFLKDLIKVNLNLVKGIHNHDIADPAYAYRQAMIRNPTAPVYDNDGSYREDFSVLQYYNPVAILNEKTGTNRSEWTRMTGNITLEPIKGWKTNLMLASHTSFSNDKSYTTSKFYTAETNNRIGEAYRSSYENKTDLAEITSKYDNVFDKHRMSIMVGYSYQKSTSESFSASNYGFPTDYFEYNNLGAGTALNKGLAGMGSSKSESKLVGFFSRVSYGFDDRYNVLLSIRHEGSSKFGDNHKWGNFPSISLGWNINNEKFMKDFSWLNNLKLRAGYGVTGVIPNDPYQSILRYSYSKGNYYNGTEWLKGLGAVSNSNPNLKWEKSKEYNIGLDFSLLNNRFGGTIDYYTKKTSDLLYWYNVPVPPNLYGQTLANVGEMENKGIEIMLNGVPVRNKNFEWNTTITASNNKNKLISLSNDLYETENYLLTAYATDPISLPTHKVELGMSFGEFWGMKSVGLSDDGFWMIEDPKTGEAVKFNDDIKADENYRQYLGSGLPKVTLGWTNTFRYKNLDLNMLFTSQLGHKILNTQRMFYQNNSIAYNRLRSAGDDVYGVRPLSNSLTQTFVSYYLENGNYLKLSNLTLGYTLNLPKSVPVSNCRVFITGENLFCITGYKGLDPELNSGNFKSAGTDDRDKYPTIRSFTFGLNLIF